MKRKQIAEVKALNLIELRRYKLLKRKKDEDTIIYTVKMSKGKRAVIMCLLNKQVVGVAYVRQLKKLLNAMEIETGIIVANARYTAACRRDARKYGVQLIPKHFPVFNIFKHELVPKHEKLPLETAEALLKEHHIKPYHLPRIKASDPAIIAIGANEGDIIKITRKSPTAGRYIAYRHVVS